MFTPRLAVLGAGLMGVGIACHFARHGHAVRLYDTDPQRLAEVPAVASAILCELEASGQQDPADRDAVLARLTPTPTLNALADATLLIEAIPERLALKHALYAELETLIADEAIIASNTSGLPPDRLAQGMRLPERLLIAHFWHPPHLIPLVEVVPGSATLPHLARQVSDFCAACALEAALLSGIVLVLVCGYRNIRGRLAEGSRTAVGGAILAAMNTASEYGFGAVIAALPGFLVLSKALAAIPNPLLNEAISVTVLAGITGSASGGMSIALAAMSETFVAAAHAANIPLEVLHRVAAMASGGMDTLPHNGAVITLLAITGLSHRQAYGGIFAITVIKSLAVLFVIATFYVTGIV